MVTNRAWSARNRWRSNGRGRSRLLEPKDAEARRKRVERRTKNVKKDGKDLEKK
jgi:hypothetical protein